ncbi:MAG: amidohydrolase [Actinomycetota bacterium]
MAADLIVHGGWVFTATGDAPFRGEVAVSHGRILEVGSDLRRHRGPRTTLIDGADGLICPGFIDAHVHPISGGLKLMRCNLTGATDAGSALEAVAAYAAANPELPWIWGGGWSLEWFPGGTPAARLLDQVLPDRPAFMLMRDGHGAWVNSRALELAGVDAATPDPSDGRIERNPDGSPQGTLHEGAMSLVETVLPPVTGRDWEQALLAGQEYLLSCGITGWQDADVQPPQDHAYLDVAGRGDLRTSVVGALWWERQRGLDQIEELLGRRAQMAPGYRPTSVKLMLDGIVENYTAAMLEPYLDVAGSPTGNAGIDFIDPVDLIAIVARLDRLGFQCHFHAIGSRAVRNALDALEPLKVRSGLRHHIAHLQVIDPADLRRFVVTGTSANVSPLWACNEPQMTELTLPFLSSRSAVNQYPFRALLDRGVPLAMGSDWPVSTADVMAQIEVAVTRRHPAHRDREPFQPDQALTLDEALTSFTLGSARVNRIEGEAGTLEVGKRADLVVLEHNPFIATPIGDIRVATTVVNGAVVYER